MVTSQVWFCDFMKDFVKKTWNWVQHVHVARWKDKHFRICTDTFIIGIVLSLVYFTKNYTLQPQNEIQSQYYHSEKVNIMVHITYRHGPDSNKENRVILKEYHFYISDDRCHHLAYVHHLFQFFYNNLKEKNIQMNQHCIWSYGCKG